MSQRAGRRLSIRLKAKSPRAATEFRSEPPAARDQLVDELGDKVSVQESDWNCGNLITYNHRRKPLDDVRVRRALSLESDQWKGAPALSKIAIVRTVGGIVFPGSPLAATKEELQQLDHVARDVALLALRGRRDRRGHSHETSVDSAARAEWVGPAPRSDQIVLAGRCPVKTGCSSIHR